MFPFDALLSGSGKEENMTTHILDLPILSGVVEFNGAGPANLQLTNLMKIDQFVVETFAGAAIVEGDNGYVHEGVL